MNDATAPSAQPPTKLPALPMPTGKRFRFALGLIAIAPLGAAVIGSAYNIWYNVIHIRPLLSDAQASRFEQCILIYNVIVYPVLLTVWLWLVFSMRPVFSALLDGRSVDEIRLNATRVRSINLPWHIALLLAIGWAGCIPAFLLGLRSGGETLHADLPMHLGISLLIAALITVTQALFSVELLVQKLLWPVLFANARPSQSQGVFSLTLGRRGLMWAISAGVCPIASLLLLGWADDAGKTINWFRLSVGAMGVAFGLLSAWLLFRLIADPVKALRDAAHSVAQGNLHTRVDLLRADEFGPLIDEFNHMIDEMREKQRLAETFGLHIGQQAAKQILAADPGLGGQLKDITVLFCDIRNFTARCAITDPKQIVSMLNLFLTQMVRIVEQDHQGMVNKYLGDGFMAMFGAGASAQSTVARDAQAAVLAGRAMTQQLQGINQQLIELGYAPVAIGIGIHTGEAIVGNIGSQQRLEYTAVGQTVNLAARIESLTKTLKVSLLLSESTKNHLDGKIPLRALAPQLVKGQVDPIKVFTLEEPAK
jgi:adenylate cyclase